jgi:hypothetical protein
VDAESADEQLRLTRAPASPNRGEHRRSPTTAGAARPTLLLRPGSESLSMKRILWQRDGLQAPAPGGPGEAALLADVEQLVADGTAIWRDDLEWILTERVAPGIELGYHVPATPLCRYPSHRGPSDWRNASGRLICGVCHPPAKGL